jgi:site-specific DNA recombinase
VPSDEWVSIPVPAILDEAMFEAVQEQLAQNRRRSRQSRRGARHLLQGLLVCAKCGYAYYGKRISMKAAKGKERRYAYYRCTGTDAYRFGGHRVCDNKQVRTDTLEDAVWEDIRDLLADPQRVEQEYERRLHSLPGEASATADQLNTHLRKLKRANARLLDAYEDGWIDKPEFEQRMRRVHERQGQLQTQADTLADDQSQRHELRLVIGELRDFAARVAEGMNEADLTARRDIIRSLVKEIQVGAESIQIVYRVNPPPFADAPERGVLQDCGRRGLPAAGEHLSALRAGHVVRG